MSKGKEVRLRDKEVRLCDLELGDVVELFEGPYGHATVKKITDDQVTFFRPYVHHDDFSYTGGVICYIGIEEVAFFKSDSTIRLARKADPLK